MTDTAPDSAIHDRSSRSALPLSRASVLADYRTAWESRHASLIGRREVLTGKGKFGIFGDGKDIVPRVLGTIFSGTAGGVEIIAAVLNGLNFALALFMLPESRPGRRDTADRAPMRPSQNTGTGNSAKRYAPPKPRCTTTSSGSPGAYQQGVVPPMAHCASSAVRPPRPPMPRREPVS